VHIEKWLVVPTYPIDAADRTWENGFMFLRKKTRTKDGKTHRYWSEVENRRVILEGTFAVKP
jgi:hypothetical protein